MRTLSMFLGCVLFAGAAFASNHDFAFDEATVAGLQARMQAGEIASQGLTRAYLERIAAIDDAGPAPNAIIELNPDALAQAAARAPRPPAGHVPGAMAAHPGRPKANPPAGPA